MPPPFREVQELPDSCKVPLSRSNASWSHPLKERDLTAHADVPPARRSYGAQGRRLLRLDARVADHLAQAIDVGGQQLGEFLRRAGEDVDRLRRHLAHDIR